MWVYIYHTVRFYFLIVPAQLLWLNRSHIRSLICVVKAQQQKHHLFFTSRLDYGWLSSVNYTCCLSCVCKVSCSTLVTARHNTCTWHQSLGASCSIATQHLSECPAQNSSFTKRVMLILLMISRNGQRNTRDRKKFRHLIKLKCL